MRMVYTCKYGYVASHLSNLHGDMLKYNVSTRSYGILSNPYCNTELSFNTLWEFKYA